MKAQIGEVAYEQDLKTSHPRFLKYAFVIIAIVIPVSYASYTNHAWEDFFISLRFGENLAQGNGLTYNPGEKVQGFSSPLTTLLLAAFNSVTRSGYETTLWSFRALSIAAYVFSGLLIFRLLERKSASSFSQAVFAGLFLLEIKTVAFSTNGMESALMMFFLALLLDAIDEKVAERWTRIGLAWAGLLWTRPDGCIYILSFVVSLFVFEKNRRILFYSIARAAALAAVLYLPWFVASWIYYGSPVPNTVIAKSIPLYFHSAAEFLNQFSYVTGNLYFPVYYEFGGWPSWLRSLQWPAGVAVLCWSIRFIRHETRVVSFVLFLVCLYLTVIQVFPWYLPPAALMCSLVLALLVAQIEAYEGRKKRLFRIFSRATSFVLVGILLFVFVFSVRELKLQQTYVETGLRTEIGKWLRHQVLPGETVYLEPMGYIGYFSGALILDYPGLVTPKVIAIRKSGPRRLVDTIPHLYPDWMILRPREARVAATVPSIRSHYYIAKIFSVQDRINAQAKIYGAPYLLYDSVYVVLKRVPQQQTNLVLNR